MRRFRPQLASSSTIEFLKGLEESKRFVVGEKLDGYREIVYLHSGSAELVARSGADHSANAPHVSRCSFGDLEGTVLDCEAVAPSGLVGDVKSILGSLPETAEIWQRRNGRLQLVVFDLLAYRGTEVIRRPFSERRKLLETLFPQLDCEIFRLERLVLVSKVDFYREVVVRGGEGVVVKDLEAPYIEGARRWLKIKKSQTWDVVVVGFTPGQGKYEGLIGSLVYGAYDEVGALVVVGTSSGMTDAERVQFSEHPERFLGRVVAVEGMEAGTRGAIRHPRLLGFRDDKQSKECLVRDLV